MGEDPSLDWSKIGRSYKPTEAIESVIEREMQRLKIAMEKKINMQDIELEEKAMIARGKKK